MIGAVITAMALQAGGGGGGAQPALSPGGYAFSATRLETPFILSQPATDANRFVLSNIYFGAPPWRGVKWRFYFPNYYVSGGYKPERCAANPLQIDFASVSVDASAEPANPITFGGASSVTIAPCQGVWSDPVAGFSPPANAHAHVRTEISVQVGGKYPVTYYPALPGSDLAEGRESTPAAQIAKQRTGAIGNGSANNGTAYGPSMAVSAGWDGKAPVFLINGTSRAWGVNEFDYARAARGAVGALARGLDDQTGGRMAAGNLSAPGAYALYTIGGSGDGFELRRQAIRALPNRPFNRIITDIGVNDINNGGGPQTLAGMQKVLGAWWAFWAAEAPGARIYQVFGEPWVQRADNNTKWSNLADQVPNPTATYPGGLQFQVNAWLKSGAGLPSNVTVIDLSKAFQSPSSPDRWAVPKVFGVLVGGATKGAAQCTATLSARPAAGDSLVLDPGQPGAETIVISSVSGLAPTYTIRTVSRFIGDHAAGAPAALAYLRDGVHEGSTLANAAAAIIVKAKTARVIQ